MSKYSDIDGTWPFPPRFSTLAAGVMHYIDQGQGDTVVLLHGNPTWAYLYRCFIAPLAQQHRVIVPDHLGFGRSDKPLGAPYSLAWHIQNLTELIQRLELPPFSLVVHDWGGPIGLGYAVDHPQHIRRLVITNTWAFRLPAQTLLPPLLQQIRQPTSGEELVLQKNALIEQGLAAGIHQSQRLTPLTMQAYREPFTEERSRQAMLALVREIPLGDTAPAAKIIGHIQERLRTLKVPTAIIWGEQDPVFSPLVLKLWQIAYPHAQVYPLPHASHFLQEDEPEQMLKILQSFLSGP